MNCGSCAYWTRISSEESIKSLIESYRDFAKDEEKKAQKPSICGLDDGHRFNATRSRISVIELELELEHPLGDCCRFPKTEKKRISDTCGEFVKKVVL